MYPFKTIIVKAYERAVIFRDDAVLKALQPGEHSLFDPGFKLGAEFLSVKEILINHANLDVIAKSDVLADETIKLELADDQRALLWVDGRLHSILGPGLHVLWKVFHEIEYEIVETDSLRFQHKELVTILSNSHLSKTLEEALVPDGHVGLVYQNGVLTEQLEPGQYAYWKGREHLRVSIIDMRERSLDVSGQEIMTSDRVTLRINLVVNYRVVDAKQAVRASTDYKQTVYREAQLGLRALVGTRTLDQLLADKDQVASELRQAIAEAANRLGIRLGNVGLRDIILPGEIRELLNKVTEAKQQAEVLSITRREEVSAMRSQANTAKMLDNNPTLMRLKELELLEKVVQNANLNIVLGDKSLSDQIINMV